MKGQAVRIPRATYQSVKREILRRITERVWDRGARIPSEIDLASEFACSRGTVNRALRELAEAGVLERRRRAGTRVAEDPHRRMQVEIPIVRLQIQNQGAAYRYKLLSRERGRAPDGIRARLDLGQTAELLHVRCLHFADQRPFQFEDRWINPKSAPGVLKADLSSVGPNEWLVREVPYTHGEVVLEALVASASEAELLGVAPGAPVMVLERVTWRNERPVTYVRLVHAPGHRMSMRI